MRLENLLDIKKSIIEETESLVESKLVDGIFLSFESLGESIFKKQIKNLSNDFEGEFEVSKSLLGQTILSARRFDLLSFYYWRTIRFVFIEDDNILIKKVGDFKLFIKLLKRNPVAKSFDDSVKRLDKRINEILNFRHSVLQKVNKIDSFLEKNYKSTNPIILDSGEKLAFLLTGVIKESWFLKDSKFELDPKFNEQFLSNISNQLNNQESIKNLGFYFFETFQLIEKDINKGYLKEYTNLKKYFKLLEEYEDDLLKDSSKVINTIIDKKEVCIKSIIDISKFYGDL